MKKILLVFLMVWLNSVVHAQNTPLVSFTYDKDGNMTARHVVAVKAPQTRSSDNDTNDRKNQQADDAFSVTLGEQKITIYPNPTTGNFTLEITPLDSKQKNFLRLSNAMGQLQQTVQIQSELTHLVIRGPAGIYLLDIYLGENVSKWKITKE